MVCMRSLHVTLHPADQLKKAPVRPASRKASSGRGSVNHGLFNDELRTSKKDKRVIKHSTFMAKVAKAHKTTPKRRRPSKKLVATLDSLADALPDAEHQDHQPELAGQAHIIKHKTLKNRPGAMKRKEKMEQLERDRFMKNMSQMNTVESNTATPQTAIPNATESNSTTSRWAALRGFISQTMEHQPAFKNAK
ncbi:hypothetical protein PISL3812_08234 [Talaromyces islandicus]|uniref:Ribosome biogenesis protein SLX9 n=1 Tax=Talaromyces islandicus TaxID=28573 RepID=A0A0U1M8E6_TALIS|nr:hypothetical protein PISL3812_08234 [Talaromyces islandicus]